MIIITTIVPPLRPGDSRHPSMASVRSAMGAELLGAHPSVSQLSVSDASYIQIADDAHRVGATAAPLHNNYLNMGEPEENFGFGSSNAHK